MPIKKFDPQKDITAYELAIIFGNVRQPPSLEDPLMKVGVTFDDQKWEELPPEIKRHWRS